MERYTLSQIRLYVDAATRLKKRDMANQVRAVSLAIAQAFGENISGVLKDLDG